LIDFAIVTLAISFAFVAHVIEIALWGALLLAPSCLMIVEIDSTCPKAAR